MKNVMKRKRKKSNTSISRTTLYIQKIKFFMQKFFFKNVCLNTKINLRLKKKHKKFLGAISKILKKMFVVAIKKMLVTQFPYTEIV